MNDPKDMETLAALEHSSWSNWTKWMIGEMEKDAGAIGNDFFIRDTVMRLKCIQQWQKRMITPYAQLSEKEKESDRKEVREKVKGYRGDTQILRSSVEILVRNDDGKLLTVTNRRWGGVLLSGGKVDPGETLIDAARRELAEETGCYPESIQELVGGIHYDEPKDGGPPWFCMAFTASGCNAPTQQEEGTEIGWHSLDELIEASIYPDWYRYLARFIV